MANPDPFAPVRADWLDVVSGINADQLVLVERPEELPRQGYYSSLQWEGLMFRERLGPYHVREVEHSFLLAEAARFDVLRHEYELAFTLPKEEEESEDDDDDGGEEKGQEDKNKGEDGQDEDEGETEEAEEEEEPRIRVGVTLTESTLASYLDLHDLDPAEHWGSTPMERAHSLAKRFLQLPEEMELAFQPLTDPNHPVFCSDPSITLTTCTSWDKRIEGQLTEDGVAFILYKRHWELERFIPADKWFSEEFRTRPDGALFRAARSGEPAPLQPFAARSDWTGKLANAMLGNLSGEALLAAAAAEPEADRPMRLHEAHAFLGMAAEQAEDLEKAMEEYGLCIERLVEEAEDPSTVEATRLLRFATARLETLAAELESDEEE